MAARKRYSVEQIIAKLREAEKLQGQGLTIPQACKRLQISDQIFYRWRLNPTDVSGRECLRVQILGAVERALIEGVHRPHPARIDKERRVVLGDRPARCSASRSSSRACLRAYSRNGAA
jgi:putative transposase